MREKIANRDHQTLIDTSMLKCLFNDAVHFGAFLKGELIGEDYFFKI